MTIKILPVIPTDATLVADDVPITIDPNSLGIAGSPTIYNVAIPTPSVEQSFLLPPKTKAFELKTRLGSELWLSYAVGQSGTSYLVVQRGNSYSKDGLNMTGTRLYFQAKAADTLQITVWV